MNSANGIQASGDIDAVAVDIFTLSDNITDIDAYAIADLPLFGYLSIALLHRALHFNSKCDGIDDASRWLGMDVPEVYSAELSEFVFAAGVKLLKEFKPDVMYLSTTDYIQHKFAPDQQGALDFYAMFDRYLAQLDELGAAIVVPDSRLARGVDTGR